MPSLPSVLGRCGSSPYTDEEDAYTNFLTPHCRASHEAAGNAFNIAYGGREYLIDIYYGLTKALGVDVEPNFGPDRKGDIKHSNADISKARKLLGYDPDYSFQDGIKLAIEWYKENL